jgi:hypothetical protein
LAKRRRWRLTLGFVILAAAAAPTADGKGASRTALAPGSLVIRDVTVISMAGEPASGQATVLVCDGRIAAIGKARDVAVPEGRGRSMGARSS